LVIVIVQFDSHLAFSLLAHDENLLPTHQFIQQFNFFLLKAPSNP